MKLLTKKEQEFILKFLNNNNCSANSSIDLLEDNFSCQAIDELRDIMPELTSNQIGGFLASLETKNVLMLEEDRGYEYNPFTKKKEKLPDLYWIEDSFLEKNLNLKW